MDYHLTFKKKEKKWGHQTNYIVEGRKLSPPPQTSKIIQFKNLRSVNFVIYIIPYFLYEVILHYKRKKEKKKKKNVISAHPGIDPGPLVPKSDTLSPRPQCQVMCVSK